MGKILSITELKPAEVVLPDGIYNGVWGGSEINLSYNGKNYLLKTEEGVRGIGIKVIVIINDGVARYQEVKN